MEHYYKWRSPALFTFDEDPKDKHTNSQAYVFPSGLVVYHMDESGDYILSLENRKHDTPWLLVISGSSVPLTEYTECELWATAFEEDPDSAFALLNEMVKRAHKHGVRRAGYACVKASEDFMRQSDEE